MVKGLSLALGVVVSCTLIAPAIAKPYKVARNVASASASASATGLTNDGRYDFRPSSRSGFRIGALFGDGPSAGNLIARAERYIGTNPTRQRTLWCSDFMNFITGGGTGSRAAKSWAGWGRPSSGKPGDVVVLSRKGGHHVGVVKGFDRAGNPVVISGNSGGRRGNRMVTVATFPAERVVSYRAPT